MALKRRLRRATIKLGIGALCAFIAACSGVQLDTISRYPRHPQASQAIERLESDDKLLQKEARVELISLGSGAMPDLAEKFEQTSPETRLAMLDIATSLREPTPILVRLFTLAAKDSSASLRQFVAYRSSLFPALAPSLALIIRPLLSDDVPAVRASAITTLGNYTPPQALESRELLSLMSDENLQVASAAAAVAIVRPEDPVQRMARAVLPKLVGGLKSTSTAERAAVIYAIGKYGIVATPAIRPLTEILASDPETEIQVHAAVALMKIGSREAQESARPALESFANGEDPALARAAQTILQRYPGTTLMGQPAIQQPQGVAPPPEG